MSLVTRGDVLCRSPVAMLACLSPLSPRSSHQCSSKSGWARRFEQAQVRRQVRLRRTFWATEYTQESVAIPLLCALLPGLSVIGELSAGTDHSSRLSSLREEHRCVHVEVQTASRTRVTCR